MNMKFSMLAAAVAAALSVFATVPKPDQMKGPFPIMSTPYFENGEVDCDGLVRESKWVIRCGSPGVIWCQSNDAIDLLTDEEKAKGFEACAAACEGADITLTLGADGTNTAHMLKIAAEIERVAARHPATRIAMISRPPDDVRTEEELEAAWAALGGVAKRPVIFQTYCSKKTPTPSVEMMTRLAERFPDTFGYIKEEASGNEANERMVKENANRPAIKTVFAGWGGWQWLYQLRQCGCEGLVTERVAYLPVIMKIWREWKSGDRKAGVTRAFAMYRLLIDQRNFPGGGLRDYSLYFLEREGVFRNRVSRRYADAKETEGGSFGTSRKWKLDTVKIPDRQKAELDILFDILMSYL